MVNQKVLRPDFIFSYWIFVWYLLFIFGVVKQNPLYILCFALLINCIDISIKIMLNYPVKVVLSFFIINFLIKVIPIFHLVSYKEEKNVDMFSFFSVFIIYIVWLWMNDMTKNTINIVKSQDRTHIPPFEHLFVSLF